MKAEERVKREVKTEELGPLQIVTLEVEGLYRLQTRVVLEWDGHTWNEVTGRNETGKTSLHKVVELLAFGGKPLGLLNDEVEEGKCKMVLKGAEGTLTARRRVKKTEKTASRQVIYDLELTWEPDSGRDAGALVTPTNGQDLLAGLFGGPFCVRPSSLDELNASLEGRRSLMATLEPIMKPDKATVAEFKALELEVDGKLTVESMAEAIRNLIEVQEGKRAAVKAKLDNLEGQANGLTAKLKDMPEKYKGGKVADSEALAAKAAGLRTQQRELTEAEAKVTSLNIRIAGSGSAIAAKEKELARVQKELAALNKQRTELVASKEAAEKRAQSLPNPEVELAEVEEQIADISEATAWQRRQLDLVVTNNGIETNRKSWDSLDKKVKDLRAFLLKLGGAAKLPVEGLSFDKTSGMLYEGRPMTNLSYGQRMVYWVKLVVALNPGIPVMVIDSGESIDAEHTSAIMELCAKHFIRGIIMRMVSRQPTLKVTPLSIETN